MEKKGIYVLGKEHNRKIIDTVERVESLISNIVWNNLIHSKKIEITEKGLNRLLGELIVIYEDQQNLIYTQKCPRCGSKMSKAGFNTQKQQMYKCKNTECGHRSNLLGNRGRPKSSSRKRKKPLKL